MSLYFFTVEGLNEQEITEKLKKEIPNYRDAMRLGTKVKKVPKFFGLIQQKKIEVRFAISDKQKTVDSALSTIEQKSRKMSEERSNRQTLVSDIEKVRRTVSIIESGRHPPGLLPRTEVDAPPRTGARNENFLDLRPSAADADIEREPSSVRRQESLPTEPRPPAARPAGRQDPNDEALRQFGLKLSGHDTDEELIDLILREMRTDTANAPFTAEAGLSAAFQSAIARIVKFRPALSLAENEKKIVVVAGPTGVGKTTTLVKLSAESYRNQIPLRFITNDTYRIGATGQIESYTNIMAAPLDIVNGFEETNRKIAEARERLIFIDTAGRSPRDSSRQAELRQFLAGLDRRDYTVESFLVLSMTTDRRDLDDTVASFSFLEPSGVILTKTDESRHYGRILNFLHKTGLAAAYFTTGQSVPEDIVPATAAALAGMIMN